MNPTETKERLEGHLRDLGTGARETSRKAWLATLGAASSVETESREVFDRLVEKGRERSKKDLFKVPAPLQATGERVKDFGRALEQRVEEGATATLRRFGVPDRREIQDLIQRIEQLTTKVEALAETRS